jgi:hypothetical protein
MRVSLLAAVVTAWIGATAAPANADAAGPSNYLSSIVEVEPDVEGVEAKIIGGDSFLLLSVDSPSVVEVVGYRGEPYLRFLPGGIVEQNDLAPTTYLNEDRYAVVDVPADASPDAEPEWRQVAGDGSFAWHDHRAHWMNEVPPPGKGPGDQILEGVVPLRVDGVDVDLSVVSIWQPAPSRIPVVAGLGAGVALALVLARRSAAGAAGAGLLLAAAALAAGLVAFLSVPSETAPEWTHWVVPALCLTLLLTAASPRTSRTWSAVIERNRVTLVFVAAVALAAWAVQRWDWMWLAILPTAAPAWLDRLVTAAALAGGVGVALAALRSAVARSADGRRA